MRFTGKLLCQTGVSPTLRELDAAECGADCAHWQKSQIR
jgi:hypothetical protein